MPKEKYYWVQIQFISGRKCWYWCTPKLTVALNREKLLNPYTYQKSLIGNYLVVAYRKYSKKDIEHLTLAKVLKIQRSNRRIYSSWHQTRSQFLTPQNIGTRLGYHYIKHDYHFVTRLHLFTTNLLWGLKLRLKRH